MLETYLLPLGAALVLFLALWPLSVWRRDVSLVDLIWGPGFLIQLAVAAWVAGAGGARDWLLIGVVGIWSARLATTLAGRRLREGHEDPRYGAMRASRGPGFWWTSAVTVFALQAVLQWLIVLGPIQGLVVADTDPGALAWAGAAIAAAGFGLETLADHQLDRFKRTAPEGALMTTGLRAHVRHPNYTGEIVFWCGVALILLDGGAWLGLLSPALITLFLIKISGAPLLDERLGATRPDYADYRAEVPGFVPRLIRPGPGSDRAP